MASSPARTPNTPLITPLPSPKRKRDREKVPCSLVSPQTHHSPPLSLAEETIRLNTDVRTPTVSADKGLAGSPRSKIAHGLQGMHLEDSLVSKLELRPVDFPEVGNQHQTVDEDEPHKDESVSRKRAKVFNISTTPNPHILNPPPTLEGGETGAIAFGPSTAYGPHTPEKSTEVTPGHDANPMVFKSDGSLGKSKGSGLGKVYPSTNRLLESKSRARKRAGTPPLATTSASSLPLDEGNGVIDAERAALTWHDDEITGHNPSDPEDDGEGINGIGFKPTPAEAYVRAQKRQAQMAEYKSREAREARAKRSERRKRPDNIEQVEREQQRRVRFLDTENTRPASIS